MNVNPARTTEWALFFKLFANLLSAGYSPAESLSQLAEDSPFQRQRLQRRLRSQFSSLPPSASLADCMKLPLFALDAATLDLFEKTADAGAQVDLLHALSARHSQANWVNQLRGVSLFWALLYLLLGGVVLSNFVIFVLPAFAGFYESFGARLPAKTGLMLALGYWTPFFMFLLALIFVAVFFRRMRRYSLLDRLGLITPFGGLLKKIALARFTHMLASLLSKNMPVRHAIIMAIPSADNAVIERNLQQAFAAVSPAPPPFDSPRSAADILKSCPLIPANFVAALHVAEKTKKLEETMPELIAASAGLLARHINMLNIATDTFSMTLVALFLGWIAMAVYEPLFKIGGII